MVTLGEIVLIHDLKRQGLTVSAIAREVGLDRKTVRKYLERGLEAPVSISVEAGPGFSVQSGLAPGVEAGWDGAVRPGRGGLTIRRGA